MDRVLMLASVASMIDKFNMSNIGILREQGYYVDVVANFSYGSITSPERVNEFRQELIATGTDVYNVLIPRKITDIRGIINSLKQVKRLYKEKKYKIVHCHSPIGGVIARLACAKARKNGTKVIYTAHGFHFFKGAPVINWAIYFPIEWICSFFTDVLITINKEDFEFAKKYMHARKICYVPGVGIDSLQYSQNSVNKVEKRKQLGVPENAIMILSVGELNENKNHEVIIKAISELKSQDLHYCIAGKGNRKEYLEKLAVEKGIANNVHFFGFRDDIKELLAVSNIFCFPSFREGLPVSLMEAMATGLPCVASKIRGNTDLVVDERNGLLVPPDDVGAIAYAIKRIINDTALKEKMSENNIVDIKCFDRSNVNKIMIEIYTEL